MNAHNEQRIPPRFVPTLTQVVEVPAGLLPAQPLPEAPVPPRFEAPPEVPLPWQAPDALAMPDLPAPPAPQPPQAPSAEMLDAWAAQITQRVLVQLDARLPAILDAQAAALAAHMAAAAAEQLRGELPALVQDAVEATLAQAAWGVADLAGGEQQCGFQAIRGADVDPG
jgi:hypothetical protein